MLCHTGNSGDSIFRALPTSSETLIKKMKRKLLSISLLAGVHHVKLENTTLLTLKTQAYFKVLHLLSIPITLYKISSTDYSF